MGSINGGLVFCPFLLKEKYQKFKADIMGLRTWRVWSVSPSNRPSPMSAGPARPSRSRVGHPAVKGCWSKSPMSSRLPDPLEGRQSRGLRRIEIVSIFAVASRLIKT